MPHMDEVDAHAVQGFPLTVDMIRDLRSEEAWLRYDSHVIGKGASKVHNSWHENWQDFANASKLIWFTAGRTEAVGEAYCNLAGQQEDYAQRVFQSGIEFIAPPGYQGFEENIADTGFIQSLFLNMLPNNMSFGIKLQNVDNILRLPGIHMPAGTGVSGAVQNGAGALFSMPGHTGDANLRNTWSWPTPVGIPSQSKIQYSAEIDDPMKSFLRALPTNLPGNAQLPAIGDNNELELIEFNNWFVIRVWNRGPRYVQLRGAKSST